MGKWAVLLLYLLCTDLILPAQALRHSISIQGAGLDFYGPQSGRYFLNERKQGGSTVKTLFWDPALRVTVAERLSGSLELVVGLHVAQLDYPKAAVDSQFMQRWQGGAVVRRVFPFVAGELGFRINLLPKEKFLFSPFLQGALSLSSYRQQTAFSLPLGLGIRMKIAPSVYFLVESQYRLPLAEPARTHLLHSAGFLFAWGKKKHLSTAPVAPAPPTPLPILAQMPADQDNDGVPDAEDECPGLPGKRSAKGCPDTDGDGFRDNVDRCPEEAGLARYEGCPIPDRDNDGFDDEVDRCPDESFEDNEGCPYVKKEIRQKVDLAAKGIYFERNSAVIDSGSFANLDEIAAIMQDQPAFVLDIEGHTDSRGAEEKNLLLSQQRADACKRYLVYKGIAESRIESVGFGEMNPIADNETEEGRAKNRRTEFELKWTE